MTKLSCLMVGADTGAEARRNFPAVALRAMAGRHTIRYISGQVFKDTIINDVFMVLIVGYVF